MPLVRCPQCGTINDTRAPDYPFCVGCQENLAKCGYCRWFDHEKVACTHPIVSGVFEVSENACPPCVYHTPDDRLLVRRRGVQVLVWALVVLGLVAVGYGVLRMGPARPSVQRPEPRLGLEVEAYYAAAVVGQPFTVSAVMYNTGEATAENVRFEIAQTSLQRFFLRSVRPKPLEDKEVGVWRVLRYPPLGPRERREIAIELVPREKGTFHLMARLVSGENVFHGVLDQPVIVAGSAPGGESEEIEHREVSGQ